MKTSTLSSRFFLLSLISWAYQNDAMILPNNQVSLSGASHFASLALRPEQGKPATVLHASSEEDVPPQIAESAARKARRIREEKLKSRFSTGEELRNLRTDLEALRKNLQWAEAMADADRIMDLRKAIKNGENRDPDVVYKRSKKMIAEAEKINSIPKRYEEKLKHMKDAKDARECIPRFNLEGLWVGKYDDKEGYAMINVTYSGDTLIATKVTGNNNVPRGRVSFTADLSPVDESDDSDDNQSRSLEPVKLPESVAEKWGLDKVSRYAGEGHIASQGYLKNKTVEGQFIMLGEHFSFVWAPMRHHVFFIRPSEQLTLKLLRDVVSKEDEVDNMKKHLNRCFEKSTNEGLMQLVEDEDDVEPFRRIPRERDLKAFMQEQMIGDTEATQWFPFWKNRIWQDYVKKNLNDHKDEHFPNY